MDDRDLPGPPAVAAPPSDASLVDPARLHQLAESGLIEASAAARLPTLDRVARLAARALRAPVAQVNLLTADAQVPAAAFVDPALPGPDGAPLDAAAAEPGGVWRRSVGLDASFCQLAVRAAAPVVVEDAAADDRVRDSRATTEEGVRAYAAVPVVTPSGAVLGTVCVVDFRPRAWAPADIAALEECAALAGEEVAARLGAAHALREAERRLRAALDEAHAARAAGDLERRRLETLVEHLPVGVMLAEAPSGRLIASNAAVRRIWGVDAAAAEAADASHHHVGYRPGTERRYASDEWPLARAIAHGEIVGDELIEIARPDGSRRLVSVSAAPVRDADGAVLGGVVTSVDVTERERLLAAERAAYADTERERALLYSILRVLPAGVALTEGPEHRFVFQNAAYRQTIGDRALVGRTPREAFPDLRGQGFHEAVERAFAAGETIHMPDVQAVLRGGEGEPAAREVVLDLHLVPVRDMHGRVTGVLSVHLDVTERVRGEAERRALVAALDAERATLRSIILQTPAPLALLVGPEHRFELVNDAYRRISGGGRDVTGLTPPEAFPELAGSGIYELFDHVYETGTPWDAPESLVRYDRDGTGVQDTWFNLRFEPVRDASGKVTAILNFAVDVTDQVRARHEIERTLADAEASRARAEAVLTSIADAFYLLDREWRFTYVNAAAEPLLQTTADALLGRTLWEAFPDVVGSPFEAPYREAMGTGRVTSAEGYFAPLGTWFDVRTYPWAGGLMVHFRDVGAQKAADAERERLLAEAQAARADAEEARGRLSLLADASAALLGESLDYEATLALAVRLAVPALADYAALDMTSDDGRIDRLAEAYHDPGRDARARQVSRRHAAVPDPAHPHAEALASGRARLVADVTDEWLRGAARSPEHLADMRAVAPRSLMLVPLRGRERVAGLLILASTTSGRRYGPADLALAEEFARRVALAADNARLFADAETARREAEAANRAKSEFLAIMSHELRTPLNAIGGYAELMELGIRGPVTPQQAEDLRRVQTSQRHLLGLINEVLNYAKLETGAVDYQLADVSLRDALAEAEALVAPQARAKGLTLATSACPRGVAARADAEKLRQVLVNLLSNAVKFTETGEGRPGRVELSCAAEGARVVVRVRDTGIGIPADKLAAIFDPFVQVRADFTRTAEGTGLGLAISRDLARGMGGDLTVVSEVGVGSTFTVALPAATPPAGPAPR